MIVYKELTSIERELGYPAKTLYAVSNSIDRHYRRVELPKSDGGARVLSVPDEILKGIQRAIADKLLAYEPVSSYAKAYKPGASVKKNAAPHVGKAKLLKLDIRNFFDSIRYSTVKNVVFPEIKYSEPIRILLSMLCYHGDRLPQGAPTSPVITNIIMREFDELVGDWCNQRNIAYTRYCDDMTFSGDFDESLVITFVASELKKRGYLLNRKKTAVATQGKRQYVTGVVVNQKLSAGKDYKRKIRQEIFYCRKFGVDAHLAKSDIALPRDRYLSSLLGKINYVLQTEPDNREFREYKAIASDMLKAIL